MKIFAQNFLLAALALSTVNVLISCAPKGNRHDAKFGGAERVQNPPAGPSTAADGTSDSGGGTGVDGKVFESYIVDPTQLPAYKQHLQGLFKNIKSNDPDGAQYHQIFKTKTWYIAPVDLEKVSKNVLGISFMKSDTQQIARQTMKEVWIDKRIYDQMSSRDQSDLLLHELNMNMYFFKFMKMSEICKLSVLVNGEKDNDGCAKNSEFFDKAMPPEKAHALTGQDNENIRFATGWLLKNTDKPVDEKDFVRVLFYKGFDKRLFKPENYGEQPPSLGEIKLSRKEFYQAIKGAELSGNMPDVCFAASNGISKHCKLEFEEKQIAYQSLQLPGFNLRLTVDSEPPVNIPMISGDEVTLSSSEDSEGSIAYTFAFTDWRNKMQIGDRVYSGFLIFKKESHASQSGLILESIVLRPGIVVSIDKKREPICQLRTPKVVKFSDDGISIRQEGSVPGLIEQMYAATPPFAACSADNVVE